MGDRFFITEDLQLATVRREPTIGRWYVGVLATGETGVLAKWNGTSFTNSVDDNCNSVMSHYGYLLQLSDQGDKHA